MPKFQIIVEDEEAAIDATIEHAYRDHPSMQRRLRQDRERLRRAKGTLVSEGETTCTSVRCEDCKGWTHDAEPGDRCRGCGSTRTIGGTNCRNCGDPEHKEACKKAGHCPRCGTAHGVGPDGVLRKLGYRAVLVEEAAARSTRQPRKAARH